MLGARPAVAKLRQRLIDAGIGILGAFRLVRPIANRRSCPTLIEHLVQAPVVCPALRQARRDRQNRDAIRIGLTERGHDVA